MPHHRHLHSAPPPPPEAHIDPYNDWNIPAQYIWNAPPNYGFDAYAMMTDPPPPRMMDDNMLVDASTSANTINFYQRIDLMMTHGHLPPPQMMDDNLVTDASTSPHNTNYQRIYEMMTNRRRPPPPRMIDDNQHIWNPQANYNFDVYATMANGPTRPWMIDDMNLVIDASTISPHTFDDQLHIVDTGLNRNRGGLLSEEAISKHVKIRAATPEDAAEICTVCQDDLHEEGKNEFIATLDCGHGYHENCIKRWLREKNACPLCNAMAIVVEDM